MITSFSQLKECFIKGGSRDDLKRPHWVFANGKSDAGKALDSIFLHTLWAIMVSLPSENRRREQV